jgi:hypothetical protein
MIHEFEEIIFSRLVAKKQKQEILCDVTRLIF